MIAFRKNTHPIPYVASKGITHTMNVLKLSSVICKGHFLVVYVLVYSKKESTSLAPVLPDKSGLDVLERCRMIQSSRNIAILCHIV